MRRPHFMWTVWAPILPLVLAGCEDGPTQTFSPTKGDHFNQGDPQAVADEAGAPLGAHYAATSKQEICSGEELQRQWAAMVHEPIRPPRFMAGFDLADGDTYNGLRIEKAEQGPLTPIQANGPTRLCQSTNQGQGGNGADVGGSLVSAWGNNGEVQMEWAVPTHKAYFLALNPGYLGTMEWDYQPKGDPKTYHYVFQIGRPITKTPKDGSAPPATYEIDWSSNPKLVAAVDELYRGIVSTFSPEIYQDTPTDCKANGTCLISATGNQDGTGRTIIGFRPASFYMQTFSPSQPQPSGSTMAAAYVFNVKYAPYSVSRSTLKMFDLEGPTSVANPIGDMGKSCVLKLGDTFDSLVNNCVKVFQDDKVGDLALKKVLGNLAHDDQNYTFSVVGINQNYRASDMNSGMPREFDVINDHDQPQPQDTADDFQLDVRTYGPISNDAYLNTTTQTYKNDYHGSGAVWREYQRLVQTDLAATYAKTHPKPAGAANWPRSLHDPACYFPANPPANFDPYAWRAPEGCTGFEGMISAAYVPPGSPDAAFNDPSFGPFFGGFKPGGPNIAFCNDPGTYNFCGFNGDIIGTYTDLLVGSLQRVTQIMGRGNLLDVPLEARDLRYYFKQFSIAMAKYMTSPEGAGRKGQHAVPADPVGDFSAQDIDDDYLIFDSIGGGANRSEYVDLTFADATHDPTSLELQMILVGSNWRSTHFYRRLDREERAMFNAMAVDESQPAWAYLRDAAGKLIKDAYGKPRANASMLQTNIFGSPAISSLLGGNAIGNFIQPTDAAGKPIKVGGANPVDECNLQLHGDAVVKTAYYCATHLDPDCTATLDGNGNPGLQAPTDDKGNMILRESGRPLLAGYCGAFSGTDFALNSGGSYSGIKILETYPLKEAVKIEIPDHQNPYDVTSPSTGRQVLVPYKPQGEGIGFPVATTGARDVFVSTAQLDFTGQVVTPIIDFLPVQVTPPGGQPYTAVKILAVESSDFLGDVVLCYDNTSAANRYGSGRPGDFLTAHMYSSVQVLLDWIHAHPGAQDSCGLIVRYSPFNNFPDFIQSSVNGVRVGIDQASGYGRVVDVTIFSPGYGTPATP